MPTPFDKILSFGGSLFSSSKSESVVGIDIGTSAIKVVQIKKKKGKAVLETYGSISLGPYADAPIGQVTNLSQEKLSQALGQILREGGVTTQDAILSIPSAASLVFILELPKTLTESQLADVIPNEARKYIPVPISEVSLDWWVIPEKRAFSDGDESDFQSVPSASVAAGKHEVLVVAIHNDSIMKYRQVVKDNALRTDFFEAEVFSSIRALLEHELAPVLILDFGASKTKLSMVEYGIVKNFHIINRGSRDITESLAQSLGIPFPKAEEMKREFGLLGAEIDPSIPDTINTSLDFIFTEANSVVLNYEKKYNKAVSKIILSGGGSLLKGFIERAEENFRVPVVPGNPFSKVDAPAFLTDVLRSIGPEFSPAVGLALKRLES